MYKNKIQEYKDKKNYETSTPSLAYNKTGGQRINKMKSEKEKRVDRQIERIMAPSRKAKKALQQAGRFITLSVDYKTYTIFKAMTETTGESMILAIKLRGNRKDIEGKPFLGNVVLVVK